MISQLCTSTLNAKKFLEKGLLGELLNLLLLGADDDIKKEAVFCLNKVVEKTEHVELWLDVMTKTGTEVLFGLLSSQDPLQYTILTAIKNLSAHPKMAQILIQYGLEGVTQLLPSKNPQPMYAENPELQGLVIDVLTNLISHDCSTVETFLSEYDDVIIGVTNLLQYSSCLQQQKSARFLATLAFYKQGLIVIASHNVVEHLLWAVTCSQCRRVREQASIALRNISKNPDRASAFSALSQVSVRKITSQNDLSQHSDSSGMFSSSENNLQRRSWSDLPGTSNHGISADRGSGSKSQTTVSELTSLLTLVFDSDALWSSGSERQFISRTSNSNDLRQIRLRKMNDFTGKEKYLRSLQVLTNCLMIMSNVILISEEVDDRSGGESVEERRLNLVAHMIQNGGLQFLHELAFLSDRLFKVNPPSFHDIDPSTLPPREITRTLKHARTELIFESTSKRKESCKSYPDFRFEQNEIDFVKEAVNLLCLFAKATAPEFDPSREDVKILNSSRTKATKRHISFQKSAILVKNVMKISKGAKGRRMIRRGSSRSLSRIVSQAGVTSVSSSKSLQSSSVHERPSTLTQMTSTQDSRETTHYVKQSLLDAKVISCLAPWIMCGIYEIQVNVLKTIRFLQHSKYSSSGSPGHPASKEAWTTRGPSSLTSRSSTLSQRSSSSAAPVRNAMNKSKYLGITCVRHVIQHCGGYLLDSLRPPGPSTLGKTTLMVLREAVVNGEADTRLKLAKLGCFAEVIEYIRGNEDDEAIQALGIVVLRILVGNDASLKQLFLAHGGMNLIMALHQYKEGIVKNEAALAMFTFRRVGVHVPARKKSRTADGRIKRRPKSAGCADIWEEVGEKWKSQDQVLKVLRKFNVRY